MKLFANVNITLDIAKTLKRIHKFLSEKKICHSLLIVYKGLHLREDNEMADREWRKRVAINACGLKWRQTLDDQTTKRISAQYSIST